jgi:RNA polymerase sigma factor (sigma-70 family)
MVQLYPLFLLKYTKQYFLITWICILLPVMLSLSSQQVVGGFNRKEAKAFALIREKYSFKAYNIISQLTEGSPETEDMVSEVFIRLWQNPVRFEQIKKIEDFIYVASRNLAINHIKKQSNESKYEDIAGQYTDIHEDFIEAKMAMSEFMNHAYKIVQAFPPQMKQVFILSFYEGLTNTEIARKMNKSEKTVANHKAIVIKRLKFEFAKRGGSDLYLLNLFL